MCVPGVGVGVREQHVYAAQAEFSVAITLLCGLGFMIPFDYVNPEQWAFVKMVSDVR